MSGAGPVCRLQTAPPTVTVVVPVLNEEHSLRQLVSELQAGVAPHAAGLQIVLVDDGSTDRTAKIASQYPTVRYISHHTNQGLSTARNTGITAARGENQGALIAVHGGSSFVRSSSCKSGWSLPI